MFRGYYHSFWHDDPTDPCMSGPSGCWCCWISLYSVAVCCPSFPVFVSWFWLKKLCLLGFAWGHLLERPDFMIEVRHRKTWNWYINIVNLRKSTVCQDFPFSLRLNRSFGTLGSERDRPQSARRERYNRRISRLGEMNSDEGPQLLFVRSNVSHEDMTWWWQWCTCDSTGKLSMQGFSVFSMFFFLIFFSIRSVSPWMGLSSIAGSAASAWIDEAAQGQVWEILQAAVDPGAPQLRLEGPGSGDRLEPPFRSSWAAPLSSGTNRSLQAQPWWTRTTTWCCTTWAWTCTKRAIQIMPCPMLETWPLLILLGQKQRNKSPCMLMSSDVYIQIKRSAAPETTLGRRWKDALRIVCWAFSGSFVQPQPVPTPCPIPSCRGPVECALEWCARKTFACRHFETLKEAFQLAHPYPGATSQLETNSYCTVRFLKFLSRDRTVLKVAARFLVGLCVNIIPPHASQSGHPEYHIGVTALPLHCNLMLLIWEIHTLLRFYDQHTIVCETRKDQYHGAYVLNWPCLSCAMSTYLHDPSSASIALMLSRWWERSRRPTSLWSKQSARRSGGVLHHLGSAPSNQNPHGLDLLHDPPKCG